MKAIVSINNRRLAIKIQKLIESDIKNAFTSFSSNGEIWKKIRNGNTKSMLKRLQRNNLVGGFTIKCGRETNKNTKRGQAFGWIEYYSLPDYNSVHIDFELK